MPTGDGTKITSEERSQVDGSQLTGELGVDAAEVQWRKEFTGFDESDRQQLSSMADTFDRIADDLVEEFYDHLQSHAETVAIMDASSKPIEALKQSQRSYIEALGRGEYGQSYFARRARIGKIHDMLDLGPKIYLGAYTIYYEGILSAIAEDVKELLAAPDGGVTTERVTRSETLSPAEAIEEVVDRSLSVLRLLTLDQQIAMDTYIHSYNERLESELARQQTVSSEVNASVSELTAVSEDVAESSQEITTVTDEQMDRMTEVTAEMEQLSATVEEVAATTDSVAETSSEAEQLAEEGRASATDAIEVIETVEDATAEVADDVDRLQSRVAEIDEVVDVIDDIADQTNMLALNASIEAARAGEAGDGFAVVADEVKNLAEESSERAGQIEETVTQIRADTEETVESLDAANDAVDRGIAEVRRTVDRLTEIVEAVTEAAGEMAELSRATDDQAASVEEVATMVADALDGAEEVRDAVDQIAAANEEQARRVEEVAESVDRLTTETDTGGE